MIAAYVITLPVALKNCVDDADADYVKRDIISRRVGMDRGSAFVDGRSSIPV